MLVPVAEFAHARGKGPRSAVSAGIRRIAAQLMAVKTTPLAAALLLAFPLGAQAQAGTAFLDFTSLNGWTTYGSTKVLSGTDSYNIGGNPFSLTPAAGNNMVKLAPMGSSIMGASAADSALGLSAGTVSGLLGSSVTNFGIISKTFNFNPGTYSFAWAYAASDYQPFNDGVLFAISGAGTQNLVSLARNGSSSSDVSGPQPSTMILGSYGSTAWVTTSFTVDTAGDYRVSYADYNWSDTGLDPQFYVTGVAGTFTGSAIVPAGGGGPSGPIVIKGNTPANASDIIAGTVAPAFDGGTLTMDTDNGGFTQDFTITEAGGTIDANGKDSAFSGVISNTGNGGTLDIVSGSGGGTVTLSGANTYTGATAVGNGATLALAGNGSIAASSGLANNGVFDISATNGAALAALTGNGSTVLGGQDLTLTNAAGSFDGSISGNGGVAITGGTQTLGGTNGFTGATAVGNGATLALSGNGSIAASSGLANNGVFDISATNGAALAALTGNGSTVLGGQDLTLTNATGSFNGSISGNGGVAITGGTQILGGANGYTGATSVGNGASLVLAGNSSIAASSGLANNGVFDISATNGTALTALTGNGSTVLGGQDLTLTNATGGFDGNISGNGGLAITGGTQTLGGVNGYTGATSLGNGATLALSGNGSIAASSGLTNNGVFDISATNGAALAALTGNGSTVLGGQDLTLTNANGSFDGSISGSGGVAITGGAQTLSGANNFTGATSVGNGASLVLSGNGGIATSSGLANNGVFDISATNGTALTALTGNGSTVLGGQDLTLTNATGGFDGNISGNGGLAITGGTQTLGGVNGYTGATSLGNGATLALSGNGSIAASSGLTNNGVFDISATNGAALTALTGNGSTVLGGQDLTLTNATGSFDGSISGNGGVAITGGTQTLSGANGFTGATTLGNGASLVLAGNGSVAASRAIVNDGTFDIGTTAGASIQSLAGSGTTTLGAQMLTVNAAADTFGGVIQGSGALTVNGGQLGLSGNNSYTGATEIGANGSLALSGAGSIAASSKVVANGLLVMGGSAPGILQSLEGNGRVALAGQDLVLANAAGSFDGVIAGNGGVGIAGGSATLSGANTFSGTVAVGNGAQLQIGADANLGNAGNGLVLDGGTLRSTGSLANSRALTLAGNGLLDTAGNTTLALSGKLAGSGNLVKQGAGTLVLGGDNSGFSGTTSIEGGTLTAASSKALGSGALTLRDGTLATTANLALAQDMTLAGGTSMRIGAATTTTITGAITGAAGDSCFTKEGGGTLNLAGASTIASGVCVRAGELRANGKLTSSQVFVASGATLRGAGSIDAPTIVQGTLAPGNSPGTLTSSAPVIMTTGSTFQEDINGTGTASGPGNYSRLLLTGTASFRATGATLAPNLTAITGSDSYTPYLPSIGERYRIVTADGGIEGRFASLLQPAGLRAGTRMAVFYNGNGGNSIDLLVLPSSYASHVQDLGENRNAQAAGAVLDRLVDADQAGTASARQSALAYAVGNGQEARLASTVRELSGEVHGAMAALAPLAGQSLQDTLARRFGGTAATALWADLSAERSKWKADASASAASANRGQLTVGLDVLRTGSTRIGAGFTHDTANLEARSGSGDLDQNIGFVYAEQAMGSARIDAMVGAGRSQWDTQRADPLGAGQLNSAADGKSVLASVGVRLAGLGQLGGATPFARLSWQRSERDAATEGNATAALDLAAYRASGSRAIVGLNGTLQGGAAAQGAAGLHYRVGLGYDTGDLLRPTVAAGLAGSGMPIVAPQVGRGFAQLGLNGGVAHGKRANSFYSVSGEVRDGRTDLSIAGGMRVSF